MKSIVKILFVGLLMLVAAIAINAGDVLFQDGGLNVSQDLRVSTNVLYVNSASGLVGIGTTSPSHLLTVAGAANISSGIQIGGGGQSQGRLIDIEGSYSSGNSGGVWSSPIATGNLTSRLSSGVVGVGKASSITGASASTYLEGVNGGVIIDGTGASGITIPNAYAFRTSGPRITTNGTVTNFYSAYLAEPYKTGDAVITNDYGLYIEAIDDGSTNNYAIYSAGGKSYFAGNVGIGTTSPTRTLHVSGNANITGNLAYGSLTQNSPNLIWTEKAFVTCAKAIDGRWYVEYVDGTLNTIREWVDATNTAWQHRECYEKIQTTSYYFSLSLNESSMPKPENLYFDWNDMQVHQRVPVNQTI